MASEYIDIHFDISRVKEGGEPEKVTKLSYISNEEPEVMMFNGKEIRIPKTINPIIDLINENEVNAEFVAHLDKIGGGERLGYEKVSPTKINITLREFVENMIEAHVSYCFSDYEWADTSDSQYEPFYSPNSIGDYITEIKVNLLKLMEAFQENLDLEICPPLEFKVGDWKYTITFSSSQFDALKAVARGPPANEAQNGGKRRLSRARSPRRPSSRRNRSRGVTHRKRKVVRKATRKATRKSRRMNRRK
jgi:hypothetical protein